METSLFSIPTIITFFLILTRISGMLLSSPMFSGHGIPNPVKIGLAVSFALILFPLHSGASGYVVPTDLIQFSWLAMQELILGLVIGFIAELVFAAVRMAGSYLAVQMGLSISSALDPMTGAQTPLIGQIYFITGFILFLSMNIHHALILAVERSFRWIPLGQGFGFLSASNPTAQSGDALAAIALVSERVMTMTGDMFILCLLVGLPVMGVLFATEASMAFMAKVMPQMNIFIVGLPLKGAIGLFVVMATLPFVANLLSDEYAELVKRLMGLYQGVS